MHWFWMLYISLYLKHYAQFIFDFLWINKLLCKVQQLFSWKFYCILGLYCSIYWHLKWWGARGCVERETYMKKMPSYLAVNITKTFLHLQLGKKKKAWNRLFIHHRWKNLPELVYSIAEQSSPNKIAVEV